MRALMRWSRRAQSELIAGVLILAVLFAAVVPLMLRIQVSTISRQENIINKAKFLQLRDEETLTLGFVPQTLQSSGIFPGIWINNTGPIPVTLRTLILIDKATGKIAYMLDFTQIGTPAASSVVEWAIINPGTPNSKPLTGGTYPTLQPGDSLLIKLALTADQVNKYYFKVVTARGNVLPNTRAGAAYSAPSSVAAASTVGSEKNWKGLFYPISGFKLIGYDQIVKSSSLTLLRGSNYVDAQLDFSTSLIWNDPQHPGFYMITVRPSIYDPNDYNPWHYWSIDPGMFLYIEDSSGFHNYFTVGNYSLGSWEINGLYPDLVYGKYYLVFTGFMGTYQFEEGKYMEWEKGLFKDTLLKNVTYTSNFIMGYFADMYMCPASDFNPLSSTSLSSCTLLVSGSLSNDISNSTTGLIRKEDLDKNGVPEVVLDTISGNVSNTWYNRELDTLALKIMVSKDITNADYIKVSAKITSYWVFYFSANTYIDISSVRKLRIAMIAIYKLNPQTGEWVLSGYKDLLFSLAKPRTFIFNAVFPVNRSDIYRVAVFLYDPYIEIGDPTSDYAGYIEFRVGLEHLFVEWGVNNKYFGNTPTVYLLALPNYAAEGIGNSNDSMEKLLNLVESKLELAGVNNYIVINNETLLNDVLLSNPPKDAIVINLHGMESPINPAGALGNISKYGWVWVNIVGYPPVRPPGVNVTTIFRKAFSVISITGKYYNTSNYNPSSPNYNEILNDNLPTLFFEDTEQSINYTDHTIFNGKPWPFETTYKDVNYFAVHWVVTVNVYVPGTYEVTAINDDGMIILLDGNQILYDWNLHGPVLHNITVSLSPGIHRFDIAYFENTGWARAYFNLSFVSSSSANLVVNSAGGITAEAGPNWSGLVNMFGLYNLPSTVWSNYSITTTYTPCCVFYNTSDGKIVSAAWAEGNGYIVVNALPPIDWTGTDPYATDPDLDATLAVFTALYIWSHFKSAG